MRRSIAAADRGPAQSPLVTNRAYTTSQISDLTDKLSRAEPSLSARPQLALLAPELVAAKAAKSGTATASNATAGDAAAKKPEESAFVKAVRDGSVERCPGAKLTLRAGPRSRASATTA